MYSTERVDNRDFNVNEAIPNLTKTQRKDLEDLVNGDQTIRNRPRIKIFLNFVRPDLRAMWEEDREQVEDIYQIFDDLIDTIEQKKGSDFLNNNVNIGSSYFTLIVKGRLKKRISLRKEKAIFAARQQETKDNAKASFAIRQQEAKNLIQPKGRFLIILATFLLQFSMIFVFPRFLPWLIEQTWYILFFFWIRDMEYGILLDANIKWKNPIYWAWKIFRIILLLPIGIVETFCSSWKILLSLFIVLRLCGIDGNLALNIVTTGYLVIAQIYCYYETSSNYETSFKEITNAKLGDNWNDVDSEYEVKPTPFNLFDHKVFQNNFFQSKPVRILGDFLRGVWRRFRLMVN